MTSVEEWRWVPSRLNVADDATKWKALHLDESSRWFKAPDFLYGHPDSWPQQKLPSADTPEEIRQIHVHRTVTKRELVALDRFSKWERLLRTIAYVHRFINILSYRVRGESSVLPTCLNQNELEKAERTIWKQIQFDEYATEISRMNRSHELPPNQRVQLDRDSKLHHVSPFLDENGVIRMETRIANADNFAQDFRFPVILSKDHYGTLLIMDWYHRQYHHHSSETVVNEMKQKYHVSRLREALKKTRKKCMWCKVYNAKPNNPRMAPLPIARTTPNIRAFTYTGLDYFGPLLIKQGRSEVKRWVALFTCLTIRAVHLEPVTSLSTESCKMAIRRFIARRGSPKEIYSDQGTNFVGASRELDQQCREINESLAETFTNTVTQWRFNPPSTPHMGGAWERMVRSVKCALASLSTIRKPNDEVFLTLLAEAESMVNSRPLTYMPVDSEDQTALTPNCFLMLSTSGVNQPAKSMSNKGLSCTSSWNLLQSILDQFWRRWVREYLPVISKRTKWFVDCRPIEVGDLVIIVGDHQRNGWIRRPVVKLAVLEVNGTAEENSEQYGSGSVPDASDDGDPTRSLNS
ncbi:uncharacterized protein LOC134222586 [Armigeres subalbatus]|uniref:uncharacterized protein LOC134222586 n=1 Tax=Armigeres subalbatus TaxID=124917 RepID=UPI002ED61E9D